MGNCLICGKPAGLFKTLHRECEANEAARSQSLADDGSVNLTAEIFEDVSKSMGRPYINEGARIEAVVSRVTELKRENRLEEAIEALLPQLDLWERDSAAGLGGVAPWYYEQAAIIYRKLGRFHDEIAVLERFAMQQHAPGASPPKLLHRLERAKWMAQKRAGIEAPEPVYTVIEPTRSQPKKRIPAEKFVPAPDQPAVSDFIALDVETANADSASICSIGLVHFRSGEVFKAVTVLVDPEDEFDPVNISIHGITPELVAGKPTMAKVFPAIAPSLSGVVVVHHNHFDRTALIRAAEKYGESNLSCIWLDTLRVARRAWPALGQDGGYGLARLANEFGIPFKHHDAAEDARAAGLLMARAVRDSGLTLLGWLERVDQPVLGPSKKYTGVGAATGPLAGETIVFTGALSIDRHAAADRAMRAGCDVANSVTGKTTILVVGDQDIRQTKGHEKSSKHRRAEEFIAQGAFLRIVGESDFLRMVSS